MPFKKIATNKYKSPSGKEFTEKQVKLYYATDGFSNMKRGSKNKIRIPKNGGGLGKLRIK